MLLTLQREASVWGCTHGVLSVDEVFECYTLEDAIREVAGKPVAEWKVQNETAIPSGKYRVIIDHSEHFGKMLPHVLDVPGFAGVRIHSGNTAADTEGCVLVGRMRGPLDVLESRAAFSQLFVKLSLALADGPVEIEILNPPQKEA